MPLFFNNRFNNLQNNRFIQNSNHNFNNLQNHNRFIQNNTQNFNNIQNNQQQNNNQSDITLKPLTEGELEKINEEIRENIEKNKKTTFNIQAPENKDIVCNYVKEFIQDETNASIFYSKLSKKCDNNVYIERLKSIYDDCIFECDNLKSYYEDLNNEKFEVKSIPINVNIPFRVGLFLAIEEEIKSYDKLCKIIDELPPQDTRLFYKMALKKLSRINSIQYMTINERY